MDTHLSLAYSTCPNDTFSFFALAHHQVSCPDLSFQVSLADVETLNQAARSCTYDITKLSFAAMGNLRSSYWLLKSGAALGRGCGPLVVARPGASIADLPDAVIAVPGMDTTARMLLGLYLGKPPQAAPMKFDSIMPEVSAGRVDFGVIIHEGRFTYPAYGLASILDLGRWWEERTGLPVPLGCIAARKSLSLDVVKQIEKAIHDSVLYAFEHPEQPMPYISEHAMEMEEAVVRQHIGLYVNDFSLDLGKEGMSAVETLFSMAEDSGLISRDTCSPFPV